ncbi:MAG: nitrate- and nitrite sensing domain-containing protein, partial [Rubrivivax sp.]|nr:nitrate- and nitrite sensing domain-containing protein [Rubrivivax sp.]
MLNILRRMKLWQKFATLGVLGAVIASIPTVQLIQRQNSELDVARSEQSGIDPVRTLVALQKQLQAHRGLASMVLSGNTAADTDRRARQADVNTQFSALGKAVAERGWKQAADEAQAMKTQWEQLARKVDERSISAKDSFEAHNGLVERNIHLIEMVADTSGLTLDPVAESYFVMTAAIDFLPRAAESVS